MAPAYALPGNSIGAHKRGAHPTWFSFHIGWIGILTLGDESRRVEPSQPAQQNTTSYLLPTTTYRLPPTTSTLGGANNGTAGSSSTKAASAWANNAPYSFGIAKPAAAQA